jgi:hypothetical protein
MIDDGGLIRVVRGVAVPAELWLGWSDAERYRARIHGIAATTSRALVFSHAAAATLWRAPWFGPRPQTIDVTFPGMGGRSTSLIRAHGTLEEAVVIDGLLVTPLARTVVDVALSSSLEAAVVVADSVLAARRSDQLFRPEKVTRLDLLRECERVPLRHGSARARAAVEFADALSGSPGESVSRVSLRRIGAPAPVLQQTFPAPQGREWSVDFWWPEFALIGEFDGIGKYLRDPVAGSVADAVIAEKWREDGLRALGPRVTRWGWSTAVSRARLRAQLADAGLPLAPTAGLSSRRTNVRAAG